MPTTNPALSDKAFQKVTHRDSGQVGWAAPQTQAGGYPPQFPPPAAPDEVSEWRPGPIGPAADTMTVNGTVTATGVLLVLLVGAGFFGWNSVEIDPFGQVQLPGWMFLAWIATFGVGILTAFKPDLARITAPLYALITGTWVGAISALYNFEYDGIVLQAVRRHHRRAGDDAVPLRHPDHRGHRQAPHGHRHGHRRHHARLPVHHRARVLRRRHALHPRFRAGGHPASAWSSSASPP